MRFLFIFLFVFACSTKEMDKLNQIVEASCGQCMFAMVDQVGCDLAIRINEKSYFVRGAAIDDFGDAHAEDGFCNSIRKAKVKGHVEESIFIVSSFELLSDDPSPES
tara:strand:- start:1493 stop:1813 length:321 start_codon:yes stop_codon:yes gene_type:complete